jgi:hypothetical protein
VNVHELQTEDSFEINSGVGSQDYKLEDELPMSSPLKIKNKHFLKAFDLAATKTLSELGDSVQTAILYHAGKIEGMKSSEVLKDPLKFADALEKIFSSGSLVLENKILDSMCNSLGIPPLNIAGSFDQKIAAVYESALAKKTNNISKVETRNNLTASIESVSYQAL